MATAHQQIEKENAAQLFVKLSKKLEMKDVERRIFAQDCFHHPHEKCGIIEITGSEGSCKTELLLHLITNTITPKKWNHRAVNGLESSCIVIDNDLKFPFLRLITILEHRITKLCKTDDNQTITSDEAKNFVFVCLENLVVLNCRTSIEFLTTVYSLNDVLLSHPNTVFLCIDNIFLPTASEYIDSANKLEKWNAVLIDCFQHLIAEHRISIVFTRMMTKLVGNVDDFNKRLYELKKLSNNFMEIYRFYLNKSSSAVNGRTLEVICCEQNLPRLKSTSSCKFIVKERGIVFL